MMVGFALWVYETLVVRFCACAVSLNGPWMRENWETQIPDSSSTNARNLSSARTTKRFPSPRCASAIQIVRPLKLIVETQPQLTTRSAELMPNGKERC